YWPLLTQVIEWRVRSVSGNDSARGNAGDAPQNTAAPAPSPRVGFDGRPPGTWPLSGAGAGAPRRPDGAASTGFAPVGPWPAAGGDASRASGLPARYWSEAAPTPASALKLGDRGGRTTRSTSASSMRW